MVKQCPTCMVPTALLPVETQTQITVNPEVKTKAKAVLGHTCVMWHIGGAMEEFVDAVATVRAHLHREREKM